MASSSTDTPESPVGDIRIRIDHPQGVGGGSNAKRSQRITTPQLFENAPADYTPVTPGGSRAGYYYRDEYIPTPGAVTTGFSSVLAEASRVCSQEQLMIREMNHFPGKSPPSSAEEAAEFHSVITTEIEEKLSRLMFIQDDRIHKESAAVAQVLLKAMNVRARMRSDPEQFDNPTYHFMKEAVYEGGMDLADESLDLQAFLDSSPYYQRKKETSAQASDEWKYDPLESQSDTSPDERCFHMVKGVFHVWKSDADFEAQEKPEYKFMDLKKYYRFHKMINKMSTHGPVKSWAHQRLRFLEDKFRIHTAQFGDDELEEIKKAPGRDFYNILKVDNHVHVASMMSQKEMLRFIRTKWRDEPDVVVHYEEDDKKRPLTLTQVFQKLDINPDRLNVDMLDVHADRSTFHRFDLFNEKYNPLGHGLLRSIFMKTQNYIKGRYFAEVIKKTITHLEEDGAVKAEPRVSVYGRHAKEWDAVASWVLENGLVSNSVRWMVQHPRIYDSFHARGLTKFSEMIDNFFRPLFEVTKDPSSHPKLDIFLQQVVGFDSVDDESKHSRGFHHSLWEPEKWNYGGNPPYAYYCFYWYANIFTLNQWRKSKNMNTFAFRPHCGEAGDLDHLTCGFLLGDSINHGIRLAESPVLQYLYYLCQIPISVSPLSNNALFLNIRRSPFGDFFARGLNVTLSSDDPLMFHITEEPLQEEYSVCSQIFNLSMPDMCELAQNSVLHSGFEDHIKAHWLGCRWYLPGPLGNGCPFSAASLLV